MLKSLVFAFKIPFVYLVLSVGCFLMLRIIIGYSSFQDDVGFLLQKKDYLHNPAWRAAFYIHVFSAVIALLAGFTQFLDNFSKNYRKLHRFIGKIYVWNILVINLPTGMILAIYANGLLPGKTAFVLLDILWFYFTYKAYICVRRGDFVAHGNYMIRSYALTFSAVTLRGWKMILSNLFIIDPTELYIMEAWLGFVPNLLVAEWIIRSKKSNHKSSGQNRGLKEG